MAIAKITGQGLAWIATLVVVLWCCILTESIVVRRARVDVQRSLVELRRLRDKRQVEPASLPVYLSQPKRPAAG